MDNGVLKIIKNKDFDNTKLKIDNEHLKKKKYLLRFTIFITISLFLFGGIFFIKNKFENIRDIEKNLNFQKQKLIEERVSIEKKLKEENENILKLKLEYDQKNKELSETLNSLKIKEETLDSQILKVRELNDLLKKQIVDMYGISIDKQYENKIIEDDNLSDSNNNLVNDTEQAVHTSMISGKDDENVIVDKDRSLSIANADWFIKFDSLGEFHY